MSSAAFEAIPRGPLGGPARLRLRGLDGGFEGCEHFLSLGQSIVLGRSRSCDLYPQLIAGSIGCEAEALRLRRMSRQHVRISFCALHHVEIEDLSRNGTRVDGTKVERVVLSDLLRRPAMLEIAGFRLVLDFPPDA